MNFKLTVDISCDGDPDVDDTTMRVWCEHLGVAIADADPEYSVERSAELVKQFLLAMAKVVRDTTLRGVEYDQEQAKAYRLAQRPS